MRHAARTNTGRYVSRLTSGTLAVVMAGGRGERLKALTLHRCKPATPFGGKFRIIDFVLSNCVNSGIRQIAVLTQYKAQPLIQHIQRGWSYLRGELGEFVELIPAQQQIGEHWYRGTADSVYQNLEFIRSHNPTHVLILAGDHIYKMDYGPMIAYHEQCEADITVGVVDVPLDRANEFGIMTTDDTNRVVKFAEKPQNPDPIIGHDHLARASMGIYVIALDRLEKLLAEDAADPNEQSRFRQEHHSAGDRPACASSPIRFTTSRRGRRIIGATWATSTRSTRRTWSSSRSIRNSTSTTINGRSGPTRPSTRPRNSCSMRKAGAAWPSIPWWPAAASFRAPT